MAVITVRRANVLLDVPDYQQEEYLAKGFDVIGPDGKVVVRATPNDLNGLKKAYTELSARVKELEAENAQLKEQLSSKPQGKKAKEPEPKPVVEESEVPEEPEEDFVPINRRGSKKKK